MAYERWKLTRDGEMDVWGGDPERGEFNLLHALAQDPANGLQEIAPGWYSTRPGVRTGEGQGEGTEDI
jgi:hypothetical protein